MREISLTEEASLECSDLLDTLHKQFATADDPGFLRRAGHYGSRLPAELLDAIDEMRYAESVATLVVRNGPVGGADCPTPGHWKERNRDATIRQDFWLALTVSQLGDPIGWSSLQDGQIYNDILPIQGQEDQQTGHGSDADLELHIEDCFSDERCDALALLCLRNHDKVPNTIVTGTDLDFSELDLDVLFSPRFLIKPDSEHVRRADNASETGGLTRPLLFGSRESPYLRVDVPYTEALPGDTRAAEALDALSAQLAQRAATVCLAEGDLLLIDNHRALHGRRTFRARYDGTDRWMRKLTVVRDLRRSRAMRGGPEDRVINPFREPSPRATAAH
ncbi:TauD/TfdA family dioxygenase [Streptomyces scopuliridis]|uniref:TauD/TfdA family dioxygenase n=1 Tax=Streptomyces scopuliridis TaxID=452529 RepID=A0ACD4ZBC2_9ACTN|nr:TauD/TfdA family dioxygenase [Streptomyces scopuliridis]WSB95615.1 TauD/TfdA family dioxygenase [Streptomyces scopuliridis]WSC10676.1 TauD/TfdA family dioxygenase [Streptomyces scopuliridis]